MRQLKESLADKVLDHKIDEVALCIAYRNHGTMPEKLKKNKPGDEADQRPVMRMEDISKPCSRSRVLGQSHLP